MQLPVGAQVSHFQTVDWLVMGAYVLVLAVSGLLLARRQRGTEDYFLGGRAMPVWAVAISVLATSLSAATFVGGPQQSFVGNLTYLSANLGAILGVLVVAWCFIPVFYRYQVTTVYELLGRRFGPLGRLGASWAFMLGRILASGARLFIAALPASLILFGDLEASHLVVAIAALVLLGVSYTLVGGIRAIIWTDVIQTVVFVGAAVAALWLLLQKIPLSLGEIVSVLHSPGPGEPSKLTVLEVGVDPRQPGWGIDLAAPYTLLTAILGFTLFNVAAYGADQDLAQRMLTCRSARKGSWSAITAILVGLPVTFLFMAIGLLLYIYYARPDLMGVAAPAYQREESRKIFLEFILREMPVGLSGLMMAGLFAAALSSFNSALGAMASTFTSDVYRRWRPERSDRHYLRVGRLAVAGWGLVLGSFAVGCVWWSRGQTLIDFALGVMTFAYAGLVAIFLAALFTRRGNGATALAALVTGFAAVLCLQPSIWSALAPAALAGWELAYPWRLLVATALAFGVCCLGRGQPTQGAEL